MFYRIRNFFIILLLVIAAALLQYTVIPRIPFLGVGPNIMLIIVVAFAYARGKNGGMLVGFMAGLFMDVFFCEVIGYNALVLVVIGFLAGFWNKYFYSDNSLVPVILMVSGELLYSFVYYIVWFLLRSKTAFGMYFTHVILPEFIFTVLIAIVLFKPLLFLCKKMYMFYDIGEA